MHRIDFQSLFMALPGPHMILDRDLRYVAVNRAYEAAVLRSSETLVGRCIFDIFPGSADNRRRLEDSFQKVFRTGNVDTLAYIPYEIPIPEEHGGGIELRYWTAVHTPILDLEGKPSFLLQNTVDVTEIARLREVASLPFRDVPSEVALLQRTLEVEEAYQESVSASAQFRRLFQQAPGMIAILQGPEQIITFANDSYVRFTGDRPLIGQSLADALPELQGQGFIEISRAVYFDGEARSGEGVPVMIRRHADSSPEEAFVDFAYNPIRADNGEITGVFVQAWDRTDSFRAMRRQRLLLDELNHRVKNTLSTIQSMARQSLRNSEDPQTAFAAFEARLMTLSQTHNILSEQQWEAVRLQAVLEAGLQSYGADRVSLTGPDVQLASKGAIGLSMAFHELAANAATHGALATPEGRVAVSWNLVPGDACGQVLEVTWQESGSRAVAANMQPGFGLRVLQRVVEGEFGGSLFLDTKPDGLICRFRIDMPEVRAVASSAA
ncbi:sensor histidine kinase [Mangrovicella endophytica]|uniref:sensor histidine kinase n=1 Tax=Mangrovicella endophytica TaxID=2066697 RepID=UPI000C9DACCC|nr:HWE histidine kinase domain-containing protein [Mangrovicella endophytica]